MCEVKLSTVFLLCRLGGYKLWKMKRKTILCLKTREGKPQVAMYTHTHSHTHKNDVELVAAHPSPGKLVIVVIVQGKNQRVSNS